MAPSPQPVRWSRWQLILLLPVAGLCFPQLYNRETPTMFGMPFFYAYQFAWVFGATILLGIVYFKTREE